MKKLLNILIAICMAVTCLGIAPVWADENSDVSFKSLFVYVTDGYSPIEGAIVSISDQTATSDADGTAYAFGNNALGSLGVDSLN